MNDSPASQIGRPITNDARIFPSPDKLASGSNDSNPWIVASRSPFKLQKRDPSSSAGELLWVCRAALQAEADERRSAADFYWSDAVLRCSRAARVAEKFDASVREAAKLAGKDLSTELQPAARFVSEVLIDGLVSSYNALNGKSDEASRKGAEADLEHICALLPLSHMTPPQRVECIRPAVQPRAEQAAASVQFAEAAKGFRLLVTADPQDRQGLDGLVGVLWAHARETPGSEITRNECIQELEQVLDRAPMHAMAYDALAQLYLGQSIDLANNHQLPEALVAIERSLAVNQGDDAVEVKQKLVEIMNSLIEHANNLQEEVRRRANVRLNSDGLRTVDQARRGFSPANVYSKSEHANKRRFEGNQARMRRFWRRLGLAEPTGNWDDQISQLLMAIGVVLELKPAGRDEIRQVWVDAASLHPDIAALDSTGILKFLDARLLDEEWVPEEIDTTPSVTERHVYPLSGAGKSASSDGVPFKDWFFSNQDRGMKWRAAAAIAFMTLGAGLGISESGLASRRDAAVESLLVAVKADDSRSTMQAAADFLAARGLCADARESQVVEYYKRSLVRWISSLPGELSSQDHAIVDRYKKLVPAATGVSI